MIEQKCFINTIRPDLSLGRVVATIPQEVPHRIVPIPLLTQPVRRTYGAMFRAGAQPPLSSASPRLVIALALLIRCLSGSFAVDIGP